MKENKYDDEVFFEKYKQMERSQKGLEGAGEWETLQALLPDFAGKRVLDLGCGYGWHCLYAAEHGAVAVTGIDISERMLAAARAKNSHGGYCFSRGFVRHCPELVGFSLFGVLCCYCGEGFCYAAARGRFCLFGGASGFYCLWHAGLDL